jgi:hypothetical protein
MRVLVLGAFAGASLAAAALPALAWDSRVESLTTRIEPRPFYGATVTIEEGVRVFRPLPRHDRVIINPNNATPVTLDVGDPTVRREYRR